MSDVSTEYQKWKQQGENLRVQAKQAMEARFRDLLAEAAQIAEDYRADFGAPLKPPSPVTAFRYKASGKSKPRKSAAFPFRKCISCRIFSGLIPHWGMMEHFSFRGSKNVLPERRFLRQEDNCYVVTVTYEPSAHPGMTTRGDILFWVNTNSLMVMKQQGDLGHRFPADEEVRWSRLTTSVRKIRLNEPISDDVFRFTPRADAVSVAAGRRGISTGGGTGFIEGGPDERRRIEHRGSHEWQGDTLIEHSKWKIRGITLTFERRLTFSDNERELNIAERIEGPQGEAEGSFKVSLK